MGRAQHGCEIAAEFTGVTNVQRQEIEQIVAQLSGFVELDRRDAQSLLINLGRAGVIGAVGGAADITLMRAHDGPQQAPLAIEYRHEGGEIGQMAAAVVGSAEQDNFARLDVLEALLDRERRPGQRTDMNWKM